MPSQFNEGQRVSLKVEKQFSNPSQTLPAGSKGTVKRKLSDGSYRVKFDARIKDSIINERDLE